MNENSGPLETWRQVILLLNAELRELYNKDIDDVIEDGRLGDLKRLMELFGLEYCLPGFDSWDSYEMPSEEVGPGWEMDYEGYLESGLDPFDALSYDES